MKFYIDITGTGLFPYCVPDSAQEVTEEQYNWAIAHNPRTIEEAVEMQIAPPPEPTLEELKDIEAAKAAREHEDTLRAIMQQALAELVNVHRGEADAKLAARLAQISQATTKEELMEE